MSEPSEEPTLRVLIAGQVPPPVGGQNRVIKRMLDLLETSSRVTPVHWKFEFTRDWKYARRFQVSKFVEGFRVWGRLIRLRCQGRIDAIVFPSGGPQTVPLVRDAMLLPAARLASKRVIIHFQSSGIAERLPSLPNPVRWFFRTLYQVCGDEAWVLTPYGKEDPESVGMEAVAVLPNGTPDHFEEEWVRSRGTTPEVRILMVGHICEEKGVPDTLEAVARLIPDHPELRVTVVGERLAPYTLEDLKAKIKELGLQEMVEVPGVLRGEALSRAYAEADLFVFASQAPESFGLVMIEAMQWALPLVVTDWRGNTQVVTEAFGGAVAPVLPDRVTGLTQALQEVLEKRSEWEEMGETNRKIYLESYTPEAFHTKIEELLLGSE